MLRAIPVFSPKNNFRFIWDLIIVSAILYAAIIIPLHVSLGYALSELELFFDRLVWFIFVADILVNFNTAVFKNGHHVENRYVIAKKYLHTWFTIDALAAFPFDLVLILFFDFNRELLLLFELHLLFKLVRLFRLTHVTRFIQKILGIDFLDPGFIKILYFIMGVSLFTHLVACGWLLLKPISGAYGLFEGYIRAVYWTITTLSTVGYGDMVPITVSQMIYTNFVMYMGVALYAYIIGNIANLLANLNLAKVQYRNKVQSVNAYLKYKKVPRDVQKKINDYYEFVWDKQLIQSESIILHELPKSYQKELQLILKKDFIKKVPIFETAEKACVEAMVFKLQTHVFAPGDYVFNYGDDDSSGIFFINSGIVEVLSHPDKTILASLHEGNFFGEMALLTQRKRSASIRCLSFCELMQLTRDDFKHILERYPDFAKSIEKIAKERSKNK